MDAPDECAFYRPFTNRTDPLPISQIHGTDEEAQQ